MRANLAIIFKMFITLSSLEIIMAQDIPLETTILAAVIYNAVLLFIYRRYIYHCTKQIAPELLLEVRRILNIGVSSRLDILNYPVELLQLIKQYDSVCVFLTIVFAAALIRGIFI